MRVAMLSPVAPAHGRGGVQDIVWSLARGLVQRGHEVALITTSRPDGVRSEQAEGVAIDYLAGAPPMRAAGGWERESERRVRALHAERPLDVIHSQSFCGLHLAGRVRGVPVVSSLHGTHVDELRTVERLMQESLGDPPGPRMLREMARAAAIWLRMWVRLRSEGPRLPRCEAVIATSREQHALLERNYHVPKDRLHDVWNGIDTAHFAPRPAEQRVRASLGAREGEPLVLAVARLYPDKGIQHLLRAFPRVRSHHPTARLVVVGDGPHRGALESLAASLGLRDAVRFTGAVEFQWLPEHYATADVFVNPTVRINGYDLTILQAMAMERPVVVSAIGSVPTAVHDGVDGVLVPPGDPVSLAAAIGDLIAGPERARALAAAARRTVTSRFSLEAMVEGTLAVYRAAAQRVARGGEAR